MQRKFLIIKILALASQVLMRTYFAHRLSCTALQGFYTLLPPSLMFLNPQFIIEVLRLSTVLSLSDSSGS